MATIEEIFLKVPEFQAMLQDVRIEMLRDLLKSKFRTLPKWATERLESATPAQVRRWSRKLLTAKTIEDDLGKSDAR